MMFKVGLVSLQFSSQLEIMDKKYIPLCFPTGYKGVEGP